MIKGTLLLINVNYVERKSFNPFIQNILMQSSNFQKEFSMIMELPILYFKWWSIKLTIIYSVSVRSRRTVNLVLHACADPESFVREAPTLISFLGERGSKDH